MPTIDPQAVPIGLVGLDASWRVAWANDAAADRLGQRASQLTGLGAALLFEGGERILARVRESLASGPRAHIADVRVRRDDLETTLDLWAAQGTGGGALLTLVDVSAREAMRAEVSRLTERLAASEREREKMRTVQRELAEASAPAPTMIGASAGMRRVVEQIDRVAPTSATVLIHGETGAGKDLVARSIHAGSPRASAAFIAVNCAALPESLIESELFGHERGALMTSSTKSPNSRPRRRPSSCECSRTAPSSASAAPRRSPWTCA